MEDKRELKAALLTIAGSLLVWSIQQLIQSATIEGVIGVLVAAAAFWAYEHVCWIQEQVILQEALEAFGSMNEEQIQEFIESGSDELRRTLDDFE